MAPPVDPAHAPMSMSSIRVNLAAAVHWSKSAVAKPVVVMTETTWKPASWILRMMSPSRPPQRMIIDCRRQHDQAIEPELSVLEKGLSVGVEHFVMQGEVGPGQKHEQCDDGIYYPALVRGYAQGLRREAARGHGGKGIAERVEEGHSCQVEKHDLSDGHEDVNHPEHSGGLLYARRQSILVRAGHLCPVELASRHAQARQYGHE